MIKKTERIAQENDLFFCRLEKKINFIRGLSSAAEQLTPDQPVSGSIPLALTFLCQKRRERKGKIEIDGSIERWLDR